VRYWLWLTLMFIPAANARGASLTVENGDFETGDFTGWTLTNPIGIGEFTGPTPAGYIGVSDSFYDSASGQYVMPITGQFMAVIGTGNTSFRSSQEWVIEASQTLRLDAGTVVSGRSFFYNGDYAAQDTAFVRLLDEGGRPIATPWLESSGTPGQPYQGREASTPYRSVTPWVDWSWFAPTAGIFTLELGATTLGDNRFASFGGHDAIHVPEPSSLLLSLVGLCGLLATGPRRMLTRKARFGCPTKKE
jgi:hypothetical protein